MKRFIAISGTPADRVQSAGECCSRHAAHERSRAMSLAKSWVMGLLCCIAGMAGNAVAADRPDGNAPAQPVNNASSPPVVAGFGPAVSASALGTYSGGSSMQQANANLSGTVTGNSASQVATGSNAIAGGAFAGASGLPSVIQNSGNNVLIQNGVVVNVQMKP
ncbi:hypothetical protein [Dyella acidiphila]|uniref:hypothetical protein n=1 Tax=Dyella acidiphila TaxID=2775866 RepID=UPI001CE3FCC4|nr:hypothetical protein [Dyella acidiphila]